MLAAQEELRICLSGIRSLVFTGSGSSEYAGECVRLPIQNELGMTVESIGGGSLLMQASRAVPPAKPGLLVSLARSGNSPESVGVLKQLLVTAPTYRHLVVTCNQKGSLAQMGTGNMRVHVITLPPETNDESLVMTSSFTNLLLAARSLGMVERPEQYRRLCAMQSAVVKDLIRENFDTLATVSAKRFARVAFLGSGTRYAAAREAALKMMEMTAGNVPTVCESYLGFRHGQ